jgi:cation:H+ antiporter
VKFWIHKIVLHDIFYLYSRKASRYMVYLYILIGLALILIGANYLTDGSVVVAKRLHIPGFLIGLTIMAIGTSAPELVVSILSAISKQSNMAIGNVLGSNIFNSFVIVGVCALVRPITLTKTNIRRDTPVLIGATLLLCLTLSDEWLGGGKVAHISRWEGLLLLTCYVASVWLSARAKRGETADDTQQPTSSMWLAALMIGGGLVALVGGGELFLHNAEQLARQWGVSETVIAITLVAGGTSMPELASSVVSVVKGHSDIALGNIIGSNIANILLVLGVSASITPLTPSGNDIEGSLVVLLLGAVLLFTSAYTFLQRSIDRWEGAIFIVIYGGYLWWLLIH